MNEHPASTIFPLMDGIELSALADDIRAHGLLDPIVLCDGMVLDGRNRLRACELAGIEPSFAEWESNGMTPTEWVVSHNLHRRHLTIAQRAALALDLLPRLEDEARERMLVGKSDPSPQSDEGRSDEKAAELVGVGRTAVANAKAIQKRDPELVNRMRAGELNIAQASREAGFEARGQGTGQVLPSADRNIEGDSHPVYFGKGDKWNEASVPLLRYLAGWEKRGFEFRHLNPRQAGKRLATVDQLIVGLQAARSDLEPRSHRARLRVEG